MIFKVSGTQNNHYKKLVKSSYKFSRNNYFNVNPLYLDFYGSEPSDLDASIDEQSEEFETFGSDRRHSIILRTKLSVRVHACIEKLYNSKGRDLRRALFSLKQIFQDDEELVHEFVKRDGLTCLVKVFFYFPFFLPNDFQTV